MDRDRGHGAPRRPGHRRPHRPRRRGRVDRSVTDGPLIVQSDKTLLLEVDHPRAEEARRAIAPFAELERAPGAHPHLPGHPAGPVERPGCRPRRRAGRQRPDHLQPVCRAPRAARRRRRHDGPVRPPHPREGPRARPAAAHDRPPGARRSVAAQEDQAAHGRTDRRRPGARAPLRARPPQAGAAQGRLARRGRGRLRRRRGAPDRPRQRELVDAALPAAGRRRVLARRLRRRGAALWRRQDPRGCGRDGAGQGHHPDPGDQHGLGPAVARRADQAHQPDRGGDRRVLRRPQGGPPGHDRDLPGADHPQEGRLHPPRPARRPRLGPDRLRRGAPPPGARSSA